MHGLSIAACSCMQDHPTLLDCDQLCSLRVDAGTVDALCRRGSCSCSLHLAAWQSQQAWLSVQGIRKYPDLSSACASEDDEVLPIGNTQALQDSAFVEAFNLRAAIEFSLQNQESARKALDSMPPRELSEVDAFTLHNRAVLNMDKDPEEGFRTLNFLVDNPPFPAETFANLLLLYVKPPHNMHDLAADLLAQHPEHVETLLSKDLVMFLDAVNMKSRAPEDAFAQFERIAKQHIEKMRLLTKMIQV